MSSSKLSLLSIVAALLAYLSLWPVAIEPQAWHPPQDRGYVSPYQTNTLLTPQQRIPLHSVGPETLALRSDGAIAAGLANGDLVLYADGEISTITNTEGRPLGLIFDHQDNLLIADAYRGLLKLSPTGKLTTLLTEAEGVPIRYANSLAIASNGDIYLSESTTRFSAAAVGVFEGSMLDINEHYDSGRIIRFSPDSNQVEVVYQGLSFANGVALTKDEKALLIAETGNYRVIKLYLVGQHAGRAEVLLDNLPGFPDNLWHDGNDRFWLGIIAPRNRWFDLIAPWPQLRKVTERLPASLRLKATPYGHVISFDQQGNIDFNLQDPSGEFAFITGALIHDNRLYLASLHERAIAHVRLPPRANTKD